MHVCAYTVAFQVLARDMLKSVKRGSCTTNHKQRTVRSGAPPRTRTCLDTWPAFLCVYQYSNEMAANDCRNRTSYEPRRCSAYPADLRWRLVYQREALNLPYEVIGRNLGVGQSTVYRTVKLFMDTGSVDKKQYRSDNLPRKLTDQVQFFIMHLVLDKPGIMLNELQKEVLQVMNVELALSTIIM